jgi:hypothetical protein
MITVETDLGMKGEKEKETGAGDTLKYDILDIL